MSQEGSQRVSHLRQRRLPTRLQEGGGLDEAKTIQQENHDEQYGPEFEERCRGETVSV